VDFKDLGDFELVKLLHDTVAVALRQ